MLERLKEFWSNLAEERGPAASFGANDHRLAAASLLVHVLDVEGTANPAESRKLEELLMKRYQLTRRDAQMLIEAARERDEEEIDFQAFTDVVKRRYDLQERRNLVEMMWRMAFGDGIIHPFEDDAVFRVADLLEIASEDVAAIRERAARAHTAGEANLSE